MENHNNLSNLQSKIRLTFNHIVVSQCNTPKNRKEIGHERFDWQTKPSHLLGKKSHQKVYNNPTRVNSLLKVFGIKRLEKFQDKKTKVVKEIFCTPEPFLNSAGMLFCSCCREILPVHKGSIRKHCVAPKHFQNKQKLENSLEQKQAILTSIANYKVSAGATGVTNMSDQERLFRYDVLFSFLGSGDPLASIDHHRPLLQKYGYKLTSATHLSDLIPLILEDEIKKIKEEMGAQNVHGIFDGATFNGECFCLLFRFIVRWKIFQRVVSIHLLCKSMVNAEISTLLIDAVARQYQLGFKKVRGLSYDRAAPNLAAMRTLATIYVEAEQLPCVSHTLDHVGEHFHTPNLSPVLMAWRGLFSKSDKAAGAWNRLALSSFPSFSSTRWWSEYEEQTYMFVHQDDRDTFVMDSFHSDFSASAYIKTLYSNTFGNSDGGFSWKLAELELVTVVECAKVFVQGTYFLEGDGLTILYAYDYIKHIERVVENQHYPLMDEYICHLVEDIEDVTDREQERAIYKAHCLEVIAPGYNYFKNNLLAGDVGACLPLYEAVRLGNPAYVKHALAVRGIDAPKAEVRTLLVMKCVNQERIEALLSELPAYTQSCTDYAGQWLFRAPSPWTTLAEVKSFKKARSDPVGLPILEFFRNYSTSFPAWAELAEDIFILSPSSAAVERVFSVLRDKFDSKTLQALVDYI